MSHENIVVIDDEQEMTQLLRLELESEGFKVSSAQDGKSGLELIRKVHPDLVILDVMMPELDGYEVLKMLKMNEATKKMPVIMLTSKGLEADIQKGLDLGADDYIAKPFHAGLLMKRIRMLLEKFNGSSEKKKILVVEDEPEMRQMLVLELETSGYEVFQAADGQEALQLAIEVRPDLIISDVLMPKLNGSEFLRKLRETDFGHNIPFMVLTARGKMKDYFEFMEVNEFLVKPFEANDLLRRVQTLINQKKNHSVPVPATTEIKEPKDPFGRKKILILENDDTAADELQSNFEDYGYVIQIVKTPAECFEKSLIFQPDMIITRFLLDGMNADKLVDFLRGMTQFKKTPILVYSNTFLEGEKERALNAGATEFFAGINGIKLLRKVNEIFNK